MPEWLSITIAVVGLIGTILGICGITAYNNERAKTKANKKAQEEEDFENYKKNQFEMSIRSIIREEMEPLSTNMSNLESEVAKMRNAQVTTIRCDMKAMLDRCVDKGYATVSEKASWNDLFEDYKGLGGNHFNAYVDQWREQMNNLPTERQSQKHILNEGE